MKTTEHDAAHMRAALNLAARGLGRVWPNPAVGCVILGRDGSVVGRGHTQKGGRPHAETVALEQAGSAAQGGCAYVTLEPCAHVGQTPPCADALIAAGIARCVVAVEDPDSRVSGRGLARLAQAGIVVETGLLAKEAKELNNGFFSRVQRGRPWLGLKLATSLDGKVATAIGESKWVTSLPAREFGHWLRASHDAIAIGSGTAIADDPSLDCRLQGLEDRSPIKVVFDRRGRLKVSSRLASAGAPTWIVTSPQGQVQLQSGFKSSAQVIAIKEYSEDNLFMIQALESLSSLGITRLLVEGGPTLATALLQARLVDRLYWFRSPALLGADGISGVGGISIQRLSDRLGFHRKEIRLVGDDVMEVLDIES